MRALVALVVFALGCGTVDVTKNKAAGAVGAAAFGVAAAGVYRATTGGCWASCRPGLRCDRPSGTCVPIEPAHTKPSHAALASSASAPNGPPIAADEASCHGLCFRGERCAIQDGVADCVPLDGGVAP